MPRPRWDRVAFQWLLADLRLESHARRAPCNHIFYCHRNTGQAYRFPRATVAGVDTALVGLPSGGNVI